MTDRGQFAGRACAWRASILAIAGFSIWVSGHAQEPAPYYRGKTITVYVGRTPGSGADLAARVFARFWSGHIPGEPTIVVRNLPGGGGTRVWNYGAEVASADGLHVLFSPTNGAAAVLNEPGLRADFSTMPFVGGLLSPNMAYVRTDKVERPEDLLTATGLRFGGPESGASLRSAGSAGAGCIGRRIPLYHGISGRSGCFQRRTPRRGGHPGGFAGALSISPSNPPW